VGQKTGIARPVTTTVPGPSAIAVVPFHASAQPPFVAIAVDPERANALLPTPSASAVAPVAASASVIRFPSPFVAVALLLYDADAVPPLRTIAVLDTQAFAASRSVSPSDVLRAVLSPTAVALLYAPCATAVEFSFAEHSAVPDFTRACWASFDQMQMSPAAPAPVTGMTIAATDASASPSSSRLTSIPPLSLVEAHFHREVTMRSRNHYGHVKML
jgi:hypothetical protein